MIIAAYAGAGKTTAAKLYPQNIVDFVCMPYKYYLDMENDEKEVEAKKADFDNVMRENWPRNYVAAIKEALGLNKILLIPSDLNVLMLLQCDKIPYILCYPQKEAKEIYYRRFIERGNTEEFINIFIGDWEQRLENLEQDDYGNHIVLRNDQFLSDVLSDLVVISD